MIALAKKFEKQPVVFVAVNSGNDAAAVAQYVKGVELDWPVIVDTNRQFESQWVQLWGGTPISLSNVHQVAFLTRDGRQQSGRWYDVEGSAKKVIAGRVDPKVMPGALAPTWKQIQGGQYAAALPALKKGLGASNPEIKNAAEFALDYAESKMREWANHANQTRKDGKSWEAYKLYASLGRAFNGYTFPEEIKAAQKELLNDEQVKKQLDAQKALDALKKTFPGVKTEVQKKKAAEKVKALVTSHADTEAATEAQQILTTVSK